MNAVKTARTIVTVESIDWKKAIDGRDYCYACPEHVALAGSLGFDGEQLEQVISGTQLDVFACELCNGELVASMREWLLDAFSSDDAQEAIKQSTAEQVIAKVKQHFEGGIAAFISTSY